MDRYLIPSVFQAIQLCDLLAQNAEGLAAAEIESALSLPRTSVFRLLRTLVSER
ncbi:MAG TPA: IclR family transcriptional regulator, partial [Alteromonas australica]|nr:IclR family transcriptional regulator [Alteromonas australica]